MSQLQRRVFPVIAASLFVIAGGCSTLRVTARQRLAPSAAPAPGTTVVVDMVMSERVLPVFPLIDAAMYNSGVNASAGAAAQVNAAKTELINQQNARSVQSIFGGAVTRVPNPFGQRAFSYEFYDRPSGAFREKVRELCAANGAERVVTSVMRVVTPSAGMFGVNGCSYVASTWYVFAKDGRTIGQGDYQSESMCAAPGDMVAYGQLLDVSQGLGSQLLDQLL